MLSNMGWSSSAPHILKDTSCFSAGAVCCAASVVVAAAEVAVVSVPAFAEASEFPQATRENAIVSDIAKATNFFILLSSCFVLQVCAYCATACLR